MQMRFGREPGSNSLRKHEQKEKNVFFPNRANCETERVPLFAERLLQGGPGLQVGQGRVEQVQDELDELPQVPPQLLLARGLSLLLRSPP